MGRMIEIQNVHAVPSPLGLRAGDVLLFHATGGHVVSEDEVIELSGIYLPAVLGDDGKILSPMGAPNTVLFRALRPGRATVDVVTGDPWHAPQTTTLSITVEG